MSRTKRNVGVVDKEFLSLERRGKYRGSKDLDWEKIPLVYDLNYCVNPEEASERFRISGFLSYEDKVMETHGLSNALYETLLEQGRIAKLLPLASNDLRRPIRGEENGGYSWLADNAAADMLGSPHDPFDLDEVRLICKKGRGGAREKLRKLQSAPSELLDDAALLYSPHWQHHPKFQHFMSLLQPKILDLVGRPVNGVAARGADPSGATYNTEMKEQTVVGKALIMAISVVKSELAETEQVCSDLHASGVMQLTATGEHFVDLPFDDDVLDRVMLAMSRVCERVCEREGSLGIPFAMCLLQVEQELRANPLFNHLIPPILSRAIDDVAHLVDLVTALNRLLQRRHHIFEAVDALGYPTAFRVHPIDRRSVAIRDYYILVEKEQARNNETLDNANARLAKIWQLVQAKVTRLYHCNLLDLYDLDIPLERHVPNRRLTDEWDGDEIWRKAGPAQMPSKAKTKAKLKMAKPGTSKDRSAAPPVEATAPPNPPATMIRPVKSPYTKASTLRSPQLQRQVLVESTPYAQSGHSYRKANGLLDKSTASNKTSRSKTNEPEVERRAPPARQEISSEHPVYQVNNRQLKLMHVLLKEPEPVSGDGGEIRWEALVQVFKRIGFIVTANNGVSHCSRSSDSDRCFFVNKPRPKPVLENNQVKELREKLQDLYGWNTDWFTSAGSRRDWEED